MMFRQIEAWTGWLTGLGVGVYIVLLFFQASKFSTEYLALHARYYLTCSLVGILAGSIAVRAFLYLARLKLVRLGPPGEQERFAIGCYAIYILFMLWAIYGYITMR